MTEQQRYRLSDEAENAFAEYLKLRREQPRFANGRSIRNALDRARMRQAVRLYAGGRGGSRLTKRDLVTLEAEDVLKSRVFEGGFYQEQEPAAEDVRKAGPR